MSGQAGGPCSLLAAFAVEPGALLALAGGGGKTALMYALADAVVARGWRVLTTTTTRIYPPDARQSPALVLLEGAADGPGLIRRRLAESARVTVAQRVNPDGKLGGVPPGLVDELRAAGIAEVIVVEADGSAGRSLKAARAGEPVFPRSSTACVLVVGVDALGMPLGEPWVFRSELAAEICDLPRGAPVTAQAAAALLVGPRGLAAAAPEASRLAVFINKVEDPGQQARAYELGRVLLARAHPRLTRVVVGSVRHAGTGFTVLER